MTILSQPDTEARSHTPGAAPRRYRQRTVIAADGTRLACRDYGPVDAECTVVMLHGFCLAQATWQPQITGLQRCSAFRPRIVSFDHRGHGQSATASQDTYTIAQLGADIDAVLTALSVRGQVILAGHSMGAMSALSFLDRSAGGSRPFQVAGLVLVATAAADLPQRGIGRLLAIPGLTALTQLVAHLPHHAATEALRTLARPLCAAATRLAKLSDGERAAFGVASTAALTNTALLTAVGFLPSLRDHDLRHVLGAITPATPVMVVSGGADVITPPAAAAELLAAIPHAQHFHDPQAGHMLLHQAAALVTTAIITVIATATSQAGTNGQVS
ncbi:alpha/beta fold hydrolase [Mycolicibacterium lutetiense]